MHTYVHMAGGMIARNERVGVGATNYKHRIPLHSEKSKKIRQSRTMITSL